MGTGPGQARPLRALLEGPSYVPMDKDHVLETSETLSLLERMFQVDKSCEHLGRQQSGETDSLIHRNRSRASA